MVELGFPGFDVRDWQGVVAPAGTPPEIVTMLANEIGRITAMPEVQTRLASLGMDAVDKSAPEEFQTLIRNEVARWGKFVREAGIRAE